MISNVLLSKIVANAQDSSWSQAYSTLNLYVVISLEKEEGNTDTVIASLGKDLFEKLQREFFALSEKRLFDIKDAVERTVSEIPQAITYSIALTTIVQNALYIVTSGEAQVLLKRGGKSGVVAKGEVRSTDSFSGMIQDNDLIILQTEGFARKLPPGRLLTILTHTDPFELSEQITPIIYEDAKGTEAAIILHYKEEAHAVSEIPEDDFEEEVDRMPIASSNGVFTKIKQFLLSMKNRVHLANAMPIPQTLLQNPFSRKKMIIILLVLILSGVLVVGISQEKEKQEKQKNKLLLEDTMKPLLKKYDEATSLLAVNKTLAIEKMIKLKDELLQKKNAFPPESSERKKIGEFIQLIDKNLSDLEGTRTVKNSKIVLDTSSSGDVKHIGGISAKGEELIVADSSNGNLLILQSDGTHPEKIATEAKNTRGMSADERYIYILDEKGIVRIDKKNKNNQTTISLSDSQSVEALDTFLGNIYALNRKENTIDKYGSPSFQKSSYLASGITLTQIPTAFTIDGSIFVLQEDAKVRKFTKGKEDVFSIKGMIRAIDAHSLLYTDADLSYLYVLDTKNKKVIILSKNGDYQYQFDISSFRDVHFLAADSKSKKIFVGTFDKLYSFDM